MNKKLTQLYTVGANAYGPFYKHFRYGSGNYFVATTSINKVRDIITNYFKENNIIVSIDYICKSNEYASKIYDKYISKKEPDTIVFTGKQFDAYIDEYEKYKPYQFTPLKTNISIKEHRKPRIDTHKDVNVRGAFGKETNNEYNDIYDKDIPDVTLNGKPLSEGSLEHLLEEIE